MDTEYRWRRDGMCYREIIRAEKYVMLRARGCVPFLVSEKELATEFHDTRKDIEIICPECKNSVSIRNLELLLQCPYCKIDYPFVIRGKQQEGI